MTATEQNNLTFSKLLNLDSFKLFAFFSTYPGYEGLALNEWQGAVGKEEERVVKEKEHKPSFEEEDKDSVFFNRQPYSVLGNFDFIFTCNTREFRSFHRIGITKHIKSFQYLYGYRLKLDGNNQTLKAPITAFCEIKIREHILQEAPLDLIILGFQYYFNRKKNTKITFRPYFTIGWIDFIVLIESENIEEIDRAIYDMQNINFSGLFLDKTDKTNHGSSKKDRLIKELIENKQKDAAEIADKIEKVKAGHVLTIVHSVFGVPADDFTKCHATCSSKSSTDENIISPMLTLSCMPGHIDYVAENVKNIFENDIQDKNIFVESGRTTLHLQFDKIPLKEYICGIKRLRVSDVYFRDKQIKETKETKETKKQLAVSTFSKGECKQFHKDAIENNYNDDFEELKTNLYCQFFHATTTLRQAYTLKQTINAACVNRQNLDYDKNYVEQIDDLLPRFEGLLSSLQEDNPCWIKVLTPVKNIINLLKIVSENPITLYALYEMLPITERLLKHLKEYNEIIIGKEAKRIAGGIEPTDHAIFVERLGYLLNDLQLCFNNLYREIFPLAEQVDTHIYYKGAVQKILSSAYGYAFETWPVIYSLFKIIFSLEDTKEDINKDTGFAGCFVVSFKNYMAMRDALPGVPVFYMSPETLFKPEELVDIPHEIVHSVFNVIVKSPSKIMKYAFVEKIAKEIVGHLDNEKRYFPFQNEINPGEKNLHDELLQEIFEYYFSSARFDKFEGIVAWCNSEDFKIWLNRRSNGKTADINLLAEIFREELSFIENPSSSLLMLIDCNKQQIKELLELVEDTICDSISYLMVGIDDFDDYAFYRLYPLSGIPEEWNDLDVLFYILARLFLVKKVADAKAKVPQGLTDVNVCPTKDEFISFCADIVKREKWLNHEFTLGTEKYNIWEWYEKFQEEKLKSRQQKWFGRIESIYGDVCRFQNDILDAFKLDVFKEPNNALQEAHTQIKEILKKKRTASATGLSYENYSKTFFKVRSELFLSLWSAEMKRRGVVKMGK